MSTVTARLQPRRKHVSLVVPFFNEGEAVHAFHDGLMPVLAMLTDYEVEIVCVRALVATVRSWREPAGRAHATFEIGAKTAHVKLRSVHERKNRC